MLGLSTVRQCCAFTMFFAALVVSVCEARSVVSASLGGDGDAPPSELPAEQIERNTFPCWIRFQNDRCSGVVIVNYVLNIINLRARVFQRRALF